MQHDEHPEEKKNLKLEGNPIIANLRANFDYSNPGYELLRQYALWADE